MESSDVEAVREVSSAPAVFISIPAAESTVSKPGDKTFGAHTVNIVGSDLLVESDRVCELALECWNLRKERFSKDTRNKGEQAPVVTAHSLNNLIALPTRAFRQRRPTQAHAKANSAVVC
jgi:hypothetical protein